MKAFYVKKFHSIILCNPGSDNHVKVRERMAAVQAPVERDGQVVKTPPALR